MEALVTDLDQLECALAPTDGRPLVVHHFATWCDPCEEELPILADLLRGADVRRVAVAWDLFMVPVGPDEAARVCSAFLERLGGGFDLLCVYTGAPEPLFRSQGIAEGTVPFTDVRDGAGRVIERFPMPLFEEDDRRRFAAAVRSAAGDDDGGGPT